jgi:hypothetical protein
MTGRPPIRSEGARPCARCGVGSCARVFPGPRAQRSDHTWLAWVPLP